MKKIWSILLAPILGILILGIALPRESQASRFLFENGNIEVEEIVDENLYIFDDSINVKGIVRGDLFTFGSDINISGSITGNLYIFGNNIEVNENTAIGGDIVVFGNNVNLKGIIQGNSTVFANTLKNSSLTSKDLMSFANTSNISGNVGDDARVFAGTSVIDSNIEGELIVYAGDSEVNEAKVGKGIYTEERIRSIAESQGVGKEEKKSSNTKLATLWTKVLGNLVSFAGIFLVGALLIFLAPVKTLDITKKITGSWKEGLFSLGVGSGILLFAWIPIIFLLVTIVGIPLAILLTGFLLFGIIFGRVWVNLAIGEGIFTLLKSKNKSPYLSLLVGGLISALIALIPFISTLYSFLVVATSIGAMVRMKIAKFNVKK